VQFGQEANHAGWTIRRPAAHHRIPLKFWRVRVQFVGENRQPHKGIALKFLGYVISVFAQTSVTWRKTCNQTDSHSVSQRLILDESAKANVGVLQSRFRRILANLFAHSSIATEAG